MRSQTTAARHAALLLAVSAALTLLSLPLPGSEPDRLLAVGGICALLAGLVAVLPWRRWPEATTLVIAVPAMGTIVAANAAALLPPRSVSMLFVLVFVWAGSHHDVWRSLWLVPVAAPAYWYAIHLNTHGLPADVRVVTMVTVVCVLVGETVARAQRRMRASEAEMRFLAEHSSDLVTRVGFDGIIRYASPSAERILGWTPEELVGTRAADYRFPGDEVPADHARRSPGKEVVVERRLRRKDGGYTWLESVAKAIEGPDGRPEVVSYARDITSRRQLQAQLAHTARHDALTGLPNRIALQEWFDATQPPSALLFVDLDGFKAVNDEHGHLVGDRLLKRVARRLEHVMREDDLVARYGGDEFVVVAGGLPDDFRAESLAARIERELSMPYRVGSVTAVIGASVGVARGEAGASLDELLSSADRRMYAVKAERRARTPHPREAPEQVAQPR